MPSSESEVNYVTSYFRNPGELWSDANVHHADWRIVIYHARWEIGERIEEKGESPFESLWSPGQVFTLSRWDGLQQETHYHHWATNSKVKEKAQTNYGTRNQGFRSRVFCRINVKGRVRWWHIPVIALGRLGQENSHESRPTLSVLSLLVLHKQDPVSKT